MTHNAVALSSLSPFIFVTPVRQERPHSRPGTLTRQSPNTSDYKTAREQKLSLVMTAKRPHLYIIKAKYHHTKTEQYLLAHLIYLQSGNDLCWIEAMV